MKYSHLLISAYKRGEIEGCVLWTTKVYNSIEPRSACHYVLQLDRLTFNGTNDILYVWKEYESKYRCVWPTQLDVVCKDVNRIKYPKTGPRGGS